MGSLAVIVLIVFAGLLIGAVVYGLVRNNRAAGKPGAGTGSDGTPRASS